MVGTGHRPASRRGGRFTRFAVIVALVGTMLVVLPGSVGVAAAAPADLDTSFGALDPVARSVARTGFTVTAMAGQQSVSDMLVQPDGKIVVVGPTGPVGGLDADFLVARYHANGEPDTSFGTNGRTVTSFGGWVDLAQAVGRQADGKIVVGGLAHTSATEMRFAVSRYNVDGSLDLTFGALGKQLVDVSPGNDLAHAMAIQANGKIVLAGAGNYSGGAADFAFARLNANGSLDTTFAGTGTAVYPASSGADLAVDVVIAPDGSIVASGHLDRDPTSRVDIDFALVRLHAADGSLDESFGRGGFATRSPLGDGWVTESAQDVAVQADGKVVVVGYAAQATTSGGVGAVMRFTASGVPDSAFGNGGVAVSFPPEGSSRAFYEVALDTTGNVVATGRDSANGVLVHRFNFDGTDDEGFGTNGAVTGSYGESAGAMAIQSDGKILVGGGASATDGSDLMLARYLGNPPAPTSSSGSGRIAFTTSGVDGSADVYITGEDGSSPVPLATGASSDSDPSLSPDGSQVVFVSFRGGGPDLYVTDTSGSGSAEPMAASGAWDADPEWSPDGTRIAFASDRAGSFDIWVYNLQCFECGANPVNITGGNGRDDGFPTWSPDSQSIAFRSTAGGNEDIFVVPSVRTEGDSISQLTTDPANDTAPTWSPDGSKIAFASNRTGTAGFDIFVMDASGENQTRVTTTTGDELFPEWSGDGRRLIFEAQRSGKTHLVSRMVDTGSEATLTPCLAYGCTPSTVSNLFLDIAPPTSILRTTEVAFFAGDPSSYSVAAPSEAYQVAATPTRVPLSHVPLQPSAPNIQSAPLGLLDVNASPIGLLDVNASPLGLLDVNASPLGLLDVNASPLGLLDVNASPLGLLDVNASPLGLLDVNASPLGLLDVNASPLAAQALDKILLSQVPLRHPYSWDGVLGRDVMPQSETLLTVLRELAANQKSVSLGQFASTGPLADVSIYSILLGPTKFSALPQPPNGPTWCERIANLGYANCGSALVSPTGPATGLSPLQWQLSGVSFSGQGDRAIPLQLMRLGAIDVTARQQAPFYGLSLAKFQNIGGSRLGTLKLSSLTDAERSALFDCSKVDCSTANLADAAGIADAIKPATTFGQLDDYTPQLLLGEVVGAVLPVGATPVAGLDLDQLNVYGYKGAGTTRVDFQARYRPLGSNATNPLIHIDLPESFYIEVDSATYSIGGQYAGTITPALSGHRATFAIPGSVPAGQEIAIRYTTSPGVRLKTATSSVSVVASGIRQDLIGAAPVEVVANFEPDDYVTSTTPPAGVSGGTYLTNEELVISHVTPGDRDFFTFPAPAPGTKIDIAIGNLSFDVDAVLYEVLEGGRRALRSTVTEQPGANNDVVVPVPDDGADLTNTGEPLTAEIREDVEFENLPVASISANRGTSAEHLSTVVTPDAKAYVLQIAGFLGASGDLPVTVFMKQTPPAPLPACAARSWATATSGGFGTATASLPSGTTSLVLLNGDRLTDRYSGAAAATLDSQTAATPAEAIAAVETMELAENSPAGVKVEVMRIDAVPAVRDAYAAADAEPCNTERANDVVRAINDAVDDVLAASPGVTLQHLTVIGDDEVIPFARIPDLTVSANESGFAGDLAFLPYNTALRAAYAGGYLPSDDPYGDLKPTPYLGRWLYVTDLAIGRVVETPTEIKDAVTQFIDSQGKLNPTSAVTTAYDFMTNMGKVIDSNAETQLGAPQADLLTNIWKKADVIANFSGRTGGPAGITSLNAHFDQYRAQPADAGGGLYSAGDVATGDSLIGKIIHTMGCHSGASLPDIAIASPSDDIAKVRDWAQVIAAKGAPSYVGQTGYGLGIDGMVELSSRILADYSKNLASSSSTGAALAEAKRAYAERLVGGVDAPTASFFGVYDEKALVEATYYGFPMYKVEGLTPVPAPAPAPTTQVSSPTAAVAYVGDIQSSDVVITPTVTETVVAGQGTQLDWRGNRLTTADRPILPLVEFPAPANLHGALITELSSTDRANFNPDFANVKVDSANKELNRETGDVIFPAAPQGVTRSKVLFVPSQFRTMDPKAGTGTLRQFTRAKVKLLTSASDDFIKPRIVSVRGVRTTTDRIDFTVETTDRTPTGIGSVVKVVVPVFDESGTWKFADLSRDAETGNWLGSANVVGRRAQYGVQAVDAAGNVGLSFNKGDLFDVIIPRPENAYRLEGFFSPVKNGILNGVQAGRTVPVKWRLYDKNGIVRNLLVVEVIDTEQIACDNREVLELTLLDLPLSALTYDVVDDHFSYGFATKKEWARTCRRLSVRLNDRSVHTVEFAFKA